MKQGAGGWGAEGGVRLEEEEDAKTWRGVPAVWV